MHHVTLRDGSRSIIRGVVPADASSLLATEHAVIDAGIGVVQSRDDLPATPEAFRDQIEGMLATDGAHSGFLHAVAERQGQIVGYGQIERWRPARVRHVANLSVGVHPDHQSLGLGRAIMLYLLDWARRSDDPPIVRVELSVRADNDRARDLYESLGFQLEGTRRRLVRDPDGREHDDLLMAVFLDEPTPASPRHQD